MVIVLILGSILSTNKPVSFRPRPLVVPGSAPYADRTLNVIDYLKTGCRVFYKNKCGSATVIYYDIVHNVAWALSCGHLFSKSQSMPADSELKKIITCRLDFFYPPKTYTGIVVFYYIQGYKDIALIRFTPEHIPSTAPIAPINYHLNGQTLHSIGCDRCSEIAHYLVVHLDTYVMPEEYYTIYNSPRPGRSGGGLLTDDGMLVGICVRTSDISGCGVGYYTPLSQIHTVLKEEGYGWLLPPIAPLFPADISIFLDIDTASFLILPQRDHIL